MPAILAALYTVLRYLIIWAVQYGLFSAIENYALPLLDSGIAKLASVLGLSDEEATDLAANKYLNYAEELGIGVAILATKTPLKVADRLGFSGKGWGKRKLSPKATTAEVASVASVKTTAELAPAALDEVATQIAKSKGVTFAQVKSVTSFIATVIGLPVGFFYAAAQYIDYAAWQNPYQKTFQKLLGYFGVDVDTRLPSAKTISKDTWTKILATVQTLGPTGITMPFSQQTLPYSEANLVKAVDEIAANIEKEGGRATYRSVWAILLPLISINGEQVATSASTKSTSTVKTSISVPQVQVFTGVLSQGVLGKGLEFQSRPDDLIESAQEMADAAANNLAPWLATLAGRITYQVKVVASITTKDGFVQRGSATTVISGYDSKGAPKYKTIINKFATLDIFVATDKGSRVKLTTIVLGPVDSVKFQVVESTLTNVENALQKVIATSDINSVKGISTVNPITITTPSSALNTQGTASNLSPVGTVVATTPNTAPSNKPQGFRPSFTSSSGMAIYTADDGNQYDVNGARLYQDPSNPNNYNTVPYPPKVVAGQATTTTQSPATTVSTQPTAPSTKPGASATNLSEWYTANGQNLPTVSARATLYQSYGLGQASYYTGTAEQNAKLLAALKG